MILNVILWITFWVSEQVWVKTLLHWFIFNVPIFVMRWFMMEYFIVLGVVAREFENLNKNLSDFEEFPNFLFRTPVVDDYGQSALNLSTYCNQLDVLKSLKNIRTTLLEASQDIADFFSFPILPTVACFSLTLVYNLYYFIAPIVISIDNVPTSSNINAATWILACIYPLILLASNVGQTLKEIFGVTVTYLVIVVQFMQSAASASNTSRS